ncbi:MAG: hypothetical protein AAF975_03015, partial [Spirochaetota bacterium]
MYNFRERIQEILKSLLPFDEGELHTQMAPKPEKKKPRKKSRAAKASEFLFDHVPQVAQKTAQKTARKTEPKTATEPSQAENKTMRKPAEAKIKTGRSRGHLVKTQITDKNGVLRYVWKNPKKKVSGKRSENPVVRKAAQKIREIQGLAPKTTDNAAEKEIRDAGYELGERVSYTIKDAGKPRKLTGKVVIKDGQAAIELETAQGTVTHSKFNNKWEKAGESTQGPRTQKSEPKQQAAPPKETAPQINKVKENLKARAAKNLPPNTDPATAAEQPPKTKKPQGKSESVFKEQEELAAKLLTFDKSDDDEWEEEKRQTFRQPFEFAQTDEIIKVKGDDGEDEGELPKGTLLYGDMKNKGETVFAVPATGKAGSAQYIVIKKTGKNKAILETTLRKKEVYNWLIRKYRSAWQDEKAKELQAHYAKKEQERLDAEEAAKPPKLTAPSLFSDPTHEKQVQQEPEEKPKGKIIEEAAQKIRDMKAKKEGLQVGQTKTENGITYILNENHRWQRMEEVEVAPLPEHLQVENCSRQEFLGELKQLHADTWVTWKDGKTQFLIRAKGLKHSNQNEYHTNERTNLTRAALYQLDKLLQKADFAGEPELKKEDRNVSNIYRYLVKASVRKDSPEEFQIIVKRRTDTEVKGEKLGPTNIVYDVQNIEGAEQRKKAKSADPLLGKSNQAETRQPKPDLQSPLPDFQEESYPENPELSSEEALPSKKAALPPREKAEKT